MRKLCIDRTECSLHLASSQHLVYAKLAQHVQIVNRDIPTTLLHTHSSTVNAYIVHHVAAALNYAAGGAGACDGGLSVGGASDTVPLCTV
jgi:hypothetical protein